MKKSTEKLLVEKKHFHPNGRRYYVYALAYPESMGGETFYIGKGCGDRIDEHEKEARAGVCSRKCDTIREIWANGEEISKSQLAFFETALEALAYEASLIGSIKGLTNRASGRRRIKTTFLTEEDRSYFGYSIMHIREDGTEFYDARELLDFFGYITWSSFMQVIRRAIKHSRMTDLLGDINVHFRSCNSVNRGKYAKRTIVNYHLSREAFLMVLMNADSLYPVVEAGKVYIAFTIAEFEAPSKLVNQQNVSMSVLFSDLKRFTDLRKERGRA